MAPSCDSAGILAADDPGRHAAGGDPAAEGLQGHPPLRLPDDRKAEAGAQLEGAEQRPT